MVTFSGTGINLALGILYSWSIFQVAISKALDQAGNKLFVWRAGSYGDPYAYSVLIFAFAMILAGRLQDKIGPRITALIGGLLVGSGFILLSQTNSYVLWILGFGVMVGTGLGFGYSAATPPALKWFPTSKTGLVSGIVVSGFGLAPVYIAPLATSLTSNYGLQNTMLFFGIAFLVVVSILSLFLVNPPKGYVPLETGKAAKKITGVEDFSFKEMLKTPAFYILWFLYFIGSGAGLMVIKSVAEMAKASMGELAFISVAIMAIGNAGGRIIAGMLSDKIGRNLTLMIMLLFQACLMMGAIPIVGSGSNAIILVLLATFIGFNYGTNLSLFPAFAKVFWGLKNFGLNYGILFTAWGVGGFVMSKLSGILYAASGNYNSSFITAAVLLVVGALLTLVLNKLRPHH